MKYDELVDKVKRFENTCWFGEFVYFKTIEFLQNVRQNPSQLKTTHLTEIVKMFLIQWGGMGRNVARAQMNWDELAKQLQSCAPLFQKLSRETILNVNLNDQQIVKAIKQIWNSLNVPNIGDTGKSKILHLFNPELFVMWDENIRKMYKDRFRRGEHEYLEFLRLMQDKLREALSEEAQRRGQSIEGVANKICQELPTKKLGQAYERKTLAKLVDEYNWWGC